MQQRPILFSTPMVQAILEGRKTMTRRVVKHKTEIENISAIIRCLGNEEDWGKFKITDVHGEDFIIKSKYNIGGVL